MTTCISIKSYDPENNMDYVLLTSDSQRSAEDEKKEIVDSAYDSKKILYNKKSQFFINHAGVSLMPEIGHLTEDQKQNYEFLINGKNLDENKIEKLLKMFGEQFNNNHYHIGFLKNNQPFLNSIGKSKHNKDLFYSMVGAGAEFSYNLLSDELENNHKNIPLKEALEMCQHGLIESASKNKATGGHMDIGVLSPRRTFLIRNLTKISNHEDFYDIEKRNLQKCKRYNENLFQEEGSLDEILLGV